MIDRDNTISDLAAVTEQLDEDYTAGWYDGWDANNQHREQQFRDTGRPDLADVIRELAKIEKAQREAALAEREGKLQ
jgi:hypothetical protein